MSFLYNIALDNGAKFLARCDENLNFHVNDHCVVRKEFFLDIGCVTGDKIEKPGQDKSKYPKIIRKATVKDQGKANENKMRAKSALRTAMKHVKHLNLEMKLLNAHYSLDGKLIIIQFTADGRVDFRELVKQLAQVFNTRIELRQIGVRDETAIYGGVGVCGRNLCCSTYLKDFDSINVRMAKDQDLSLNPSSISGICGRLKCCLKYEHEGYLELQRDMPRVGDTCETQNGRGHIVDRNLLTREVTVQLDETDNRFSCDCNEVRIVYPEKYKIPRNKK